MKINANISALQSARNVNRTNDKIAKSLERLSSGYKINKVSDDPTGTAISSKVKAQLFGLQLASKNSADGISLVQTAEGAMSEIHEMLGRLRELAVQAANDTNVTSDREKLQVEVGQLVEAIDTMVDITEFNQMKLINGRLGNLTTINDVGGNVSHDISVKYMSPEFPLGDYSFTINNPVVPGADVDVTVTTTNTGQFETLIEGNRVTITNEKGEKMIVDVEEVVVTTPSIYNIEIEDKGQLKLQTGPNDNQRTSLMIPCLSPESLGIRIKDLTDDSQKNLIDLTSARSAEKSISILDEAVSRVSTMRSTLGAYQNRLEHLVKNIDVNSTNTSEALSRIQDTDMALEMSSYTLNSVIMQSGIAMMSQANERPQQLLQLLR